MSLTACQDSVVDHRLRVHGIGRLRVADASIMPRLVGGNTHAVCVMIGHRAAGFILEDLEDADGDVIKASSPGETPDVRKTEL